MKKKKLLEIEICKRFISSLLYGSTFLYLAYSHHLNIFYVFLSILMIGSIYEFFQINKKIKNPFLIIITLIYIVSCFLLLIKIKLLETGNIKLIILITHIWASDIGGFLIGKTFGKHMLSSISPKKTWEGVIGSLVFCIFLSICLKSEINSITSIYFILTSIILCISAIVGDLIISCIKRVNNKKESGFFLAGQGGFLDRLDSMYLTTIIYYLVICI